MVKATSFFENHRPRLLGSYAQWITRLEHYGLYVDYTMDCTRIDADCTQIVRGLYADCTQIDADVCRFTRIYAD